MRATLALNGLNKLHIKTTYILRGIEYKKVYPPRIRPKIVTLKVATRYNIELSNYLRYQTL